jgi:excisionase family DNA binding protein
MATQATAAKQRAVYSPRQLGERWGRDRLTIIEAIRNGKLRAFRLRARGHYLIPASEVARVERGE